MEIEKTLTGTIVNYYTHCKRQCWLFSNMLNMEDNSEDVHIGKVLHEIKYAGQEEISLEGIKLDKLTDEYVIEMKKTDADINAAKAQLLYYMVTLRDKGVYRKGQLVCLEKNKQEHSRHSIDLTDTEVDALREHYNEIKAFINNPVPPDAVLAQHCRKCAYYEYCFI